MLLPIESTGNSKNAFPAEDLEPEKRIGIGATARPTAANLGDITARAAARSIKLSPLDMTILEGDVLATRDLAFHMRAQVMYTKSTDHIIEIVRARRWQLISLGSPCALAEHHVGDKLPG